MEALVFLTYLGIILLIGIISTLISRKLGLPNILFLILTGILLNKITYNEQPLFQFPDIFLTSIGILALVMIVFDSSSRLKMKEFDLFSVKTLKLSTVFLLANMIFLSFFAVMIFKIPSYYLAVMFAALMSGTDPSTVFTMFKQTKNKVIEMLEIESIINTPLIVLMPFIILDLMGTIKKELVMSKIIEQISPFLQQFVAGIGAGILVGIIVFKLMKRKYSETLSPLAIITATLLTYILAENLGGNGVLAVTVMGIFFGNVYLKEKNVLQEFSSVFASSLQILVFVLVGFIINIPLNTRFLVKSFTLFLIYLIIRFGTIQLLFSKEYNLRERIFMSFNVQKGIAVAVVIFILTTYMFTTTEIVKGIGNLVTVPFISLPGAQVVLNLSLAFILYSIITSTIMIKLSKYFLKMNVGKEEG
jgi:NhaP-type Na+/H+ or K+/H+ antiporter|tara:strand:+ start:1356 stop:2609 length:1254 start_codon:yes stop_codon:yes gene_type:complete